MTSWIAEQALIAASRSGSQIAVASGKQQTTYSDFAKHICKIADFLCQVAPAPRVAICLENGREAYAAMFATLRAGGFYTPLNPKIAGARLRTMLNEIEPHVVICSTETVEKLIAVGAKNIVCVADILEKEWPQSSAQPAHRLAYVMYTSGSTGSPKGVMVSQDALRHYVSWAQSAMQPVFNDRWSQHPNIGFDLSVLDIYAGLLSGVTICPLATAIDKLLPARAIKREKMTIWNSVPSVMGMMLSSGEWKFENVKTLRLITFCGEPLLPEHLDGIFSVLPDVIVHNTYGPTEATVSCSLVKLDRRNYKKWVRQSAALGDAIGGMSFHVRDLSGQEPGAGELFLSGAQLADGYWNDPQKTDERFTTIDLGGSPVRAYATGDWVENVDGGLYFRQRHDNQVKVKGHRIELDEISAQVRKFGFHTVETVVKGDQIITCIEGKANHLNEVDMRHRLQAELEVYMVPNQIRFFEVLPRNANDKIDTKALRNLIDANTE